MMVFNSLERACLAEILLKELVDDFGFVIGRAEKRYTLWQYYKENNDGRECVRVKYMHVLSPERYRVEHKFPGVFICDQLRGKADVVIEKNDKKHASNTPVAPAKPTKTLADYLSLPFGQFKGVPFREVSASYWAWLMNSKSYFWDEENAELDFRPIVEENCIKTGCTKMFGRWYAPASDEDRPWVKVAREILPKIEKNEEFSFVPDANKSSFWYGIDIRFKHEDTYYFRTYYGGGEFLVITDKKGNRVNKRTKGKTIIIKEYHLEKDSYTGKDYVLVDKFELK